MEDRQSPIEKRQSPRSLLGLGVAWTRVGYGVLVLAVLALALSLLVRPAVPAAEVGALKVGAAVPVGQTAVETPKGRVAVPPGFQVMVDGEDILAYPQGYRLAGGRGGGIALLPTPLGMASLVLIVFSVLTGFVWTLVDVVDRRRRFVWLIPMFVCPLVGVLHAIPLALYLFYGRETPDPDANV